MKSRELLTINDLIASNYTITKLASGNYLHKFTPATTATVYEFEANATPVIVEGERYNIGYTVDSKGRNIIDLSALSPTSQVNPMLSFLAAQQIAKGNYTVEKAKNDQRVTHSAKDGYYWGKNMHGACSELSSPKRLFFNTWMKLGTHRFRVLLVTLTVHTPMISPPHTKKMVWKKLYATLLCQLKMHLRLTSSRRCIPKNSQSRALTQSLTKSEI